MPLRYKCTFKVTGCMDFPVDMLRTERASPSTSEDAGKLLATARDLEAYTTPRTIELVRFVETTANYPTEGRWRSFGWVVDMKSVEFKKY